MPRAWRAFFVTGILGGMPQIIAENLTKTFRVPKRYEGRFGALRTLLTPEYQEKAAVRGVSFTLEPGELVGYVGPNGAGKSTTIKMLTGILTPTSGEVRVGGLVPWKERERNAHQIGVVFGQRTQLWWDLPLSNSFELLKHIYRVDEARFQANLKRFDEVLGLSEFMMTPVRQLSLGQRMRGDLAAALLHDPPILFLDEPTIGLDVVAKERIREFIQLINRERQVTVILTTHDMQDIERLCRRMILIDKGQVLYDGTVENLKDRSGRERLMTVVFAEPPPELDLPGAEVVLREGAVATLRFDRNRISSQELVGRVSARYPVVDLTIEEAPLEDIIRSIYQKGLTP